MLPGFGANLNEMEHLVPQSDGRLAQVASRTLELEEVVFPAINTLFESNVINRCAGFAPEQWSLYPSRPFSRYLPCHRPYRATRRNERGEASDPR